MSWLWKSDASSPASFEKALSKLTTQITSGTLSLESSRSRYRRVKALWTIYTIVAYLLYTLILILVLGPQKWNVPHYAGLLGAPLFIYGVRKLLTVLSDWQISRKQSHVEDLQKQRESKINDLKKATKYDSTQELLQKYGAPPKQASSKSPQQGTKRKIATLQTQPQRTGIPPPPTANIPDHNVSSPQRPMTPASPQALGRPQSAHSLTGDPVGVAIEEPGFAPNAFSGYALSPTSPFEKQSNWYDRVLDVILGDDETLAKNRLVLICSKCRLVNGQAPPGVRTLEEVGVWRCSSCGMANGVESETTKMLKEMSEKITLQEEDHNHRQRVNHTEGAAKKNLSKLTDGLASEEPTKKVTQEAEDIEDGAKLEGTTEATGTMHEASSEEDGQVVSKRVTRSSRKKYDDDDQGW